LKLYKSSMMNAKYTYIISLNCLEEN